MLNFLFAATLLSSNLLEEEGIRRIQAHLLIEDHQQALKEATSLQERFPESLVVNKMLVEALSHAGEESEALDLWNRLSRSCPDLLYDRHLLEEMCWGILKKGTRSSQYGTRLAATIGAFLTKDVRAIPILLKMLRDSNAVIRSIAVQMAALYRDAPLQDEIARLMREERVWLVKMEVIQAVGALRMKQFAPEMQKLVQSERTMLEERQVALNALLAMYDEMDFQDFLALAESNRAGLRHLACLAAAHFEIVEAKKTILKLMEDSNAAVRIAALNTYGLVFDGSIKEIEKMFDDPDPTVAITASWAACRLEEKVGKEQMKRWLLDSTGENRRLAAAAVATLGQKGVGLAKEVLSQSKDPYVLVNLALGLLSQREELQKCSDILYEFCENEKRMIMVDQRVNPLFSVIGPSEVRYHDQIPNYPEAQDQMTRLKLLSFLAVLEDQRALLAAKSFLKRKSWGLTGASAALLLHEGDDAALEKVSELLHDENGDVRLQAALVLATFKKDPECIRELQGAYHLASHEKKLHILEAIGQIGTTESFSFLVSVLQEPFPILRISAAAALIQSVNR